MKVREWVKLFRRTVLLSSVILTVCGLVGEFIVAGDATNVTLKTVFVVIFSYVFLGLLFGVLSHVGFFFFNLLHQYGLSLFRSRRLWNVVQILIAIYTVVDLSFLHTWLGKGRESTYDLFLVFMFLIVTFVVSYYKVKQSSVVAFVPALFYLIVCTSLEWNVANETGSFYWSYLLLFNLVICNSFQLFMLNNFTKKEA